MQPCMHGTSWRRFPLFHYLYHSLTSGQTTRREHSPTHQQKNEIKINWAWPCLSEQDPVFPSVSLPWGSFHEHLILIHQRTDRLKTTIPENLPNWSHGPQPCLTQLNNEPCSVGPGKDRSCWRVLTKCDPLEKGMANSFSIPALRTPWSAWKGKKIAHWKMYYPGL